jgi:hypothetical protein
LLIEDTQAVVVAPPTDAIFEIWSALEFTEGGRERMFE